VKLLILKTATRSVAVLPNIINAVAALIIFALTKVTAFVLLLYVIDVKLATFHVLFNKLKNYFL
jgi:hypothetical protein